MGASLALRFLSQMSVASDELEVLGNFWSCCSSRHTGHEASGSREALIVEEEGLSLDGHVMF